MRNQNSTLFLLFTFLGSLAGIGGEYQVLSSVVAIISSVLIFLTIRELSRARKLRKLLLQKNDACTNTICCKI